MNIQDILLRIENDLKRLKKEKKIPLILLNIIEIATYFDLQEDIKWANYELSGYPDPHDKTGPQTPEIYPFYRRIIANKLVKKQGTKDSYISGGSVGFWNPYPIEAIVKSRKRGDQVINTTDNQGNQHEITIFRNQNTALIDGVKSKIREFYAKITKDGLLSKLPLKNNQLFIKTDLTESYWADIHLNIAKISRHLFSDGYYAQAVLSAFKEVNNRVKNIVINKTGEELDGKNLMFKAFNLNDPIIQLSNCSTRTEKDIQEGYGHLFAGAIQCIRNPKAHENISIDKKRAVHLLYLASLLMYKLDELNQ